MKKILLFFTIILIFGCETFRDKDNEIAKISCPNVFFSSENNVYLKGNGDNLDLDKIGFKAKLDNYAQFDDCLSDNLYNNYFLDLLVIVEPFNPQNEIIDLPIFAIFYDKDNKIIDRQYFKIIDKLNLNTETSSYLTTDVIRKLNFKTDIDKTVDSITIGFVKILK
ncbi:hypothetical protein N9U75_03290 [Pelagibacteraceae bacterium]|nr:hypothetical protein [Pelagibacteraceae bacterium]